MVLDEFEIADALIEAACACGLTFIAPFADEVEATFEQRVMVGNRVRVSVRTTALEGGLGWPGV